MNQARLRLHHALFDHRVDIEEKLRYSLQLNSLSDAEADRASLEMVREIEERYPLPTREEYLREFDASGDWYEMNTHKRIYWHNLKEVLNDAVRFNCMNVAKTIAPLFAFENHEEVLTAEMNADIRERLFGVQNLQPLPFYESRPYCMKFVYEKTPELISWDSTVRQLAWQGYSTRVLKSSMISKKRLIGEVYRCSHDPEFETVNIGCMLAADAIGLSSTGKELIWLPWPDALLDGGFHPYLGEHWKLGQVASILRLAGWDLFVDGITNELGKSGYWYINSVTPEHEIGEGNLYINGILDEDEDAEENSD